VSKIKSPPSGSRFVEFDGHQVRVPLAEVQEALTTLHKHSPEMRKRIMRITPSDGIGQGQERHDLAARHDPHTPRHQHLVRKPSVGRSRQVRDAAGMTEGSR